MEEQTKIEHLSDQLKSYMDTRYDLIVLQTYEKVSTVGSQFIAISTYRYTIYLIYCSL